MYPITTKNSITENMESKSTLGSIKTSWLILVLFGLFLSFPTMTFGQRTMSDLIEEQCDLVWFGLDFTRSKMIGIEDFSNPEAIRSEFFRKWNIHTIHGRKDPYYPGVFNLMRVKNDTVMMPVVNQMVKLRTLFLDTTNRLTDSTITDIISKYNLPNYEDGVGAVVMVETLNRQTEKLTAYIVFFDLHTKYVLYTRKIVGKPTGYGFEAYWSGAVHNLTRDIRGPVMEDIRKKYGKEKR